MPPAFFNIMEHLVYEEIHTLAIFGSVNVRWMYSVERMNKVMKDYVRNLAWLKACMAEGYFMDESLGYITEYL